MEELQSIGNKSFEVERITRVRDFFLFSCYTGLAYADVEKLRRSEITSGVDGGKWIFSKRRKTNTLSIVKVQRWHFCQPTMKAAAVRYKT